MAWAREIEAFARNYFAGDPVYPEIRSFTYYWDRKRRLVLDLIRAHFEEFGKSPTFVDLGCGDGIDLAMLATYVNQRLRSQPDDSASECRWRFIGVEGFPESVDTCRARMVKANIADFEVRAANIVKALPIKNGEVDLLYCSEVLEHIPDVEGMIAEMKRVVKPGGHVLMTTPNQPNVFQRSYWSSTHARRLHAGTDPVRFSSVDICGEMVDIYGHISLRKTGEWDECFRRAGFSCVDFRRGAATYGGHRFLNKTPFYQLRLAFEWLLDRLPLSVSRNLSDQVIALYRRVD